jgi:ADP-ribose diphosphatase
MLLDGVEFTREVVEHPGAAVIFPVHSDGGIVLVRQFRHAVGQTLLELPAGTLEPGEAPEACAARELMEETGFRAGKLDPLGIVYSSPGVLGEAMHFFLARDLQACGQDLDPGEKIEVVSLTVSELWDGIRSGDVRDGKTVVGASLAREFLS